MTPRPTTRLRLAHILERERGIIIALIALAMIAVAIDVIWLGAVPQASRWDLVLQLGMGLMFLSLLAWELLDTSHFAQRVMFAVIVVAAAGNIGRLYLGLFGPAWSGDPDLSLPTSLGYLPVITLGTFAFLPRREAARISAGILLITIAPYAIYLATHLDRMAQSPRLLELTHTVVLINPIAYLLGLIISRVHLHLDAVPHDEPVIGRTAPADTDFAAMTYNRPGITRALQEAVATARTSGHELTVALLEVSEDILDERDAHGERGMAVRQVANLIKTHFPATTTMIGHLSRARFIVICQGTTVAPVADICTGLLDDIDHQLGNGGSRVAHVGLALYQPGETTARLVKRADDQLQDARTSTGYGIAFNADEAI